MSENKICLGQFCCLVVVYIFRLFITEIDKITQVTSDQGYEKLLFSEL